MAHFYKPDGTFVDGLREARKCNALPSPSTVLGLMKGQGLIEYFKRQVFEATATTPRRPEWTDDEYYEAVIKWSEEHAQTARDKGGDFHSLVQAFHKSCIMQGPRPFVPPDLSGQYDAYLAWYENAVEKTLLVEEVVMGKGYGGRVDHVCRLKDGRLAVCDPKTQGLSAKKKKFSCYTNWALQLGAYWGGTWIAGLQPDVLISICVSSGDGPVQLEAYEWPKDPDYYHQLFLGLLAIWREENNYDPEKPLL